jgi:membrane associated rhomboid family serine protease
MGGFIPLTDSTRRPTRFPIITTGLIVINFIVFLLELSGGDPFVVKWSAVPADITAGHHLINILTGMFMHGGWLHIIGNMIYLWAFGPEIEDSMNPVRFLAFYIVGGVVAMLAQVALAPHSTVPTLGASGAIAAVMGAFIVTYPRDEIKSLLFFFFFVRVTMLPAALIIGFWFVIQLFHVGSIAAVQQGGVAYAAHVGGAIFGAITAHLFEDPKRVGPSPQA